MTDHAPSAADPVALARALIECPSVTPEEGGALAFLEGLLSPKGFEVHRPVFAQKGTPDVENLFAAIGTGGRHLVFAGHTDVVPPGTLASWRHPPFSGAIENGVLYGRGAVDMKGGIAAFLAAALDFVADRGTNFGGRISLLITGDEEGPSINGTAKLLKWADERGERFSAAIVGEPTNPSALGDQIKIGRRGSLSGEVSIGGHQGHVAYPHLADNPVRALGPLLAALMDPPLDTGTENFQPSNLEVTSVETDTKVVNVIPARADVRFNVRFNDLWTEETLKAEIAARVERARAMPSLRRAGLSPVDLRLTFQPVVSDVFITHSPELVDGLANAVEAVTGRRPELGTGGGTSDARFIKDYCPVVEFGLVGDTMHQIDERVPVADLVTLSRVYRRFLDDYFS